MEILGRVSSVLCACTLELDKKNLYFNRGTPSVLYRQLKKPLSIEALYNKLNQLEKLAG